MRRRLILLATAACLLVLATIPTTAMGGESTGWVRVTFDHRITQSDRSALEAAGLASLQYSPVNAYLAFGSSEAAEEAAGLGGVASVRAMSPASKISSGLSGRSGVVPL